MGGLAIAKVRYDRYLKFVWPLLLLLFLLTLRAAGPRICDPGTQRRGPFEAPPLLRVGASSCSAARLASGT